MHKRNQMGGYISYTENEKHKCIFFDRDSIPHVITTIIFDDSFVPEAAAVDTMQRNFTPYEKDLHIIRQKALAVATTDTIFKWYENTSLNPIPVIYNNKKKVYFLTGPSKTGVVIFGNDYLVTFDKRNNIKSVKSLHKNIIPISFTDNPQETVTMHSHTDSTGHYITATDICTLMLYCPYTNWKQHYVISSKNVSIFDCYKSKLVIITRKAWEKISKHRPETADD